MSETDPAKAATTPERLVVIDGKSVFYRGYYAMPNLSTKEGTPTGGVYGFAVLALEIVKRLKPDYVAVAWDKAKTNIRSRRLLYPEYKAGRKPAPPDFYEQVPILHELLDTLGWPLYEADDYEADDLMGAFAKQAGEKGIESYLVTSDLDVLQLVNAHTHIFTLKKGLTNIDLFNEASFREKYGIGAHQWVDTKALKGDSSDNIPGVAGIGEKTALDLIQTYETLDGVYEHLDDIKPNLRAKLEKDRDMAYLSKKLATIWVDAPIMLDFDRAELGPTVRPEFIAELRKLEFRNLLRQLDTQPAAKPAGAVSAQQASGQAELIPSEEVGFQLEPAKKIAWVPEHFKPKTPRVIALDPDAAHLWVSADAGSQPATFSVLDIDTLVKDTDLQQTLANGPVVGHDLKSVFRVLLAADLAWPAPTDISYDRVGHDTRIAAFILNSLIRSQGLDDILEQSVDLASPEQVISSIWNLHESQMAQFKDEPQLQKVAHDIDFPTIYLLANVEHRGILLDTKNLEEMSVRFEGRIKEFEQKIYELATEEFTIGSPMQLGHILFEVLELPTQGVKKGKTGYSTDAKTLDKLRDLHPIVDLITTWREYTKLKSTYIDSLPKLVDHNGKLHTTFALDVAATGRLSSHDPNLQNIPTRTEIGQAIRGAFLPAKGNVFVSADYSQFELRLAAVMAGDKQMIEDFNQDIDIHTATAAQVYNVPIDQVDKNMRRHAKTVNFGVLYGMSPHGLSVATNMSLAESKEFIDKYFELRAPIRKYMDDTVKHGLEEGYVQTIFGRRRPTPDLKSSNFMVRESAKRVAINMPIQGTEADLMKLAMLAVEDELADDGTGTGTPLGQQILQVHDSIMVETPAKNAEKVGAILKQTMENIYPELPVKLKVDISTGRTWGEL